MKNNNYKIWYKDLTDSVFVKSDSVEISYKEKFELLNKTIIINWRTIEYRFKKRYL